MNTYSFSYAHNDNLKSDVALLSDLKTFLNDHDIETCILHLEKGGKFNLRWSFDNERDLNLALHCWELLQIGHELDYLYANFFKGDNFLSKFYP